MKNTIMKNTGLLFGLALVLPSFALAVDESRGDQIPDLLFGEDLAEQQLKVEYAKEVVALNKDDVRFLRREVNDLRDRLAEVNPELLKKIEELATQFPSDNPFYTVGFHEAEDLLGGYISLWLAKQDLEFSKWGQQFREEQLAMMNDDPQSYGNSGAVNFDTLKKECQDCAKAQMDECSYCKMAGDIGFRYPLWYGLPSGTAGGAR